MAVTAKELVFKIIGENAEFNTAVAESTQKLDDFKKKTKDTEQAFGEIAKQATIVTTAITAVGMAAVKLAVDFNEGFARVETLIPGATERVKELQDNVLELSPAVGKSTQDLTDGLYEIISAFGDSADSAKTLEIAAKAATAGGATTKQAISLLSAVTKGYGDTSEKAQQKVSDLAFTTLKLGQTSMTDLAASMQRVTAMSNTLSVSQEELFAIFSAGTGVIGGAAEVSTQLSAVYTEMLKPGERLAKAFAELGVATGQELIDKMGGITGALDALKSVADKTGEPISNLFGSVEAGKIALYTTGAGAKKLANDLQAMQNVVGAADTAFNAATSGGVNSFGFQMQQAALNAKTFAIKIGQELLPSLQALLTPLFKGIEALNKLDESTIAAIVSVGKILLTVTATTAAVFGFTRAITATRAAILKAKAAFGLLKAAFASNPFGLIVIGVTSAIVAIKELCNWFDRAREKQFKLKLESLDNMTQDAVRAQRINDLAQEYVNLTAKEKLSNAELQKKKELEREIENITKARMENGSFDLSDQRAFAKDQLSDMEYNLDVSKKQLAAVQQFKQATEKVVGDFNNIPVLSQLNNIAENVAFFIPDSLKAIKGRENALAKADEEIEKLKAHIAESEKGIAGLKDFTQNPLPQAETELMQALPEAGAGTEKTSDTKTKTQAARLAELDKLYQMEIDLLEKANTSEAEKQAAKEKLDEEHYKKRLELLKTFHKENLTSNLQENAEKNLTLEQSLEKRISANNTIKEETEATSEKIKELSDERHKKEIADIEKITEKTKEEVEKQIAIKESLGAYENKSANEVAKEKSDERILAYKQKQNELMQEYQTLIQSASQKDKEKADAFLKQIDEMQGAINDAGVEVEKTFAEIAREVADKMTQIGGIVTKTFSDIADMAKSIINSKDAQQRYEAARKIAEIEKEKNETLLEIDNELAETREEKAIEDAEREEERREEEHQKQIDNYDRSLAELQGQFEAETNLEKLRNQEKQIEAERKKKAEELARKKEEDEKRKRDKEFRMQEIAMMNARNLAEHEFAVARIQTENAAGDASAKAAQQAAKWQKAQGVINMSIKMAIETAEAVANFAAQNYIGGAMHTAAATMAGVQAGVIAGQPLPPDYIMQPLPPAPRPIKFAKGGIVYPKPGGTPINLASGYPGIVGEAGIPEIILPVNSANLEKVFAAAGINNTANSQSINYSPSYNLEITQNADDDITEKIFEVLQNDERRTFNILQKAKTNWFVGD